MPVDRSKLEELIEDQVKAIEATHGEDWEIGEVCCIVEVRRPGDNMEVRFRHSGNRVIAAGLLSLTRDTLSASGEKGMIGPRGEQKPYS